MKSARYLTYVELSGALSLRILDGLAMRGQHVFAFLDTHSFRHQCAIRESTTEGSNSQIRLYCTACDRSSAKIPFRLRLAND
jgi:hypothetical protein